MLDFRNELFSTKVNESLNTIKRILDLHRNPRLAEDVDHQYGDKYLLVEQMANTALIAQLNVLTYFGLTTEILKSIDPSKSTTLRFQASTSCTFLKEQIVDVPSQRTEEGEQHVESSLFGSTILSTIKQVVHEVHEYHWKVDVDWEVSLYSGYDVEEKTTLKRRSSSMVLIIQSNKEAPLPEHQEYKPVEFSLSSLLKFVNTQKMVSTFAIDRDAPTTKTPFRNEQVGSMVTIMSELNQWTCQVQRFFVENVLEVYKRKHNPAGSAPTLLSGQGDTWSLPENQDIFVPVLPLMVTLQTSHSTSTGTSSSNNLTKSLLTLEGPKVTETLSLSPTPIPSTNDMHTVLNEQVRAIEERIASLSKTYPSSESTMAWSVDEVILVMLCPYLRTIGERFADAVNYVENMLRNQLVAAVGKHIQLSDIERFVRYHNARLLNPAPKSFCHAVRLLGHDPYGLLSIESTDADGTKTPIQTLCREVKSSNGSSGTVKVPLNSATTVELSGHTYLHGWIHHRFGRHQRSFELIARARQFSTFLLVVGTMSGSDQLEPKDAIIVQNKDEVLIPLILEEIPTAKEFKDAINSLSPEQQRFAKAFRSMQLASSVMGVCVIQIKPQLEVLLGLGQGALTKEMQLTQDLMELFIEYQVPSDLVSYDGTDPGASRNERVANVRGHVKAVLDVIQATKEKELQEKLSLAKCPEAAVNEGNRGDTDSDACLIQLKDGAGEIYVRTDGKKVRGVKKINTSQQKSESYEIIVKPDGTKVRRVRKIQPPSELVIPSSAHQDMANSNDVDYTQVPKLLDSAIEACSSNVSLRSTTIKLDNQWKRNRQADLLSKPVPSMLERDGAIRTERNKAFDLLDALCRSGSLSIAFSEVHVIVAVTHSFEKDVIDTIVQDNINPIEKLEMSTLLVGSVIHGVPVSALVREGNEVYGLTHFV